MKKTVKSKTKQKFKFTKKNIALILAISLGFLFIVASLFIVDSFSPANPKVYHRWFISTFAGSFDGENTPNTYHQIDIKKDIDSGESLYSCIDLELNPVNGSKNPCKEIWINLSDVQSTELNIFFAYGHTLNVQYIFEKTLTEKDIRADKDGWFLLYSSDSGLPVSGADKYLKIGFSSNVRVREIYFVGLKNTIRAKAVSCTYGLKPTKDKSVNHEKSSVSTADNVVDEAKTFKVS